MEGDQARKLNKQSCKQVNKLLAWQVVTTNLTLTAHYQIEITPKFDWVGTIPFFECIICERCANIPYATGYFTCDCGCYGYLLFTCSQLSDVNVGQKKTFVQMSSN